MNAREIRAYRSNKLREMAEAKEKERKAFFDELWYDNWEALFAEVKLQIDRNPKAETAVLQSYDFKWASQNEVSDLLVYKLKSLGYQVQFDGDTLTLGWEEEEGNDEC